MSFYISYTKNFKTRKTPHTFYFEEGVLCMFSIASNTSISIAFSSGANPIETVLKYIQTNNIKDSEICISFLSENLLDEACKLISKYLYENDDSIGLITDDENYRSHYSNIINKYGITYSGQRKKQAFYRPKETSSQKKVAFLDVEEIEEEINKPTKVYAPRRVKPEGENKSGLMMDEPFNTKLVNLLNESGKTNVEVYTNGGISRQVFSNILSKKDFIPKKDTVICLIIGMELNYADAISLLASAGYTLSKSIVFDVVVMKYLKKGIYDYNVINSELDERGCSLLGWKPREN